MIWYDMLYNTWRTFFFHEGWTMVFKVVGGQPGPAGYISQLWTSADSLNEDVTNVLGIRRSFPIPYKNRLVSSWQTTKPKEVRHIEISKADRTTWKLTLHDINTTPIEPHWSGVVLSRPLTAVSLCFDFYRCCVYVSQSKFSLAEFSVLLGNFFCWSGLALDPTFCGIFVCGSFLHANSELTQQDRRAKKAANLVPQAWQWFSLKKIGLKLHLPLNRSFRKRLKNIDI